MATAVTPRPARTRPDSKPRSLGRRALQFSVGLSLCAVAVWLTLQVGLGLSPWDVLHAGLVTGTGASFGTVVVAVGVAVLGVSALLGVRPGIGTLVNLVVVGLGLDWLLATSWLDTLPQAPLAVRLLVLVGAVAVLGIGGALYIGSGFGAGPRDSLMVACHRKSVPLGPARCLIELSVLFAGWLLGGPVGIGTVVVALGLGPAVSASFRLLGQDPSAGRDRR